MRGVFGCVCVFAFGACTTKLDFPATTSVQCEVDDQCPGGTFCSTLIGQCVASERADSDAPQVVSSVVEPPVAGPNAEVVVRFSTNEELNVATLDVFGSSYRAEPTGAQTYQFVVRTPDSGVSGPEPLRAVLSDASGNAVAANLAELELDYDAPTVSSFSWDSDAPTSETSAVFFTASTDVDASVTRAEVVDEGGLPIGSPELSTETDSSGATPIQVIRGLVRVETLDASATQFAVALELEDTSGNRNTVMSPLRLIDRDPPETVIDSSPLANDVRLRAAFAFSSGANDLAGFECSLDGSEYAPCESPFTQLLREEGVHTFAVRAIDSNGLVDPTPAEFSWSEDRVWAGAETFSSDCAIASDGTLWCWDALTGSPETAVSQNVPVQVGEEADWLAIASNSRSSNHNFAGSAENVCGIRDDGGTNSLWCWGFGLSVAGATVSNTPRRALEDGFAQLSLENGSACGIKLDGSLWCVGTAEQLGTGSVIDSNRVVRVGDANDWVDVSVDSGATCGIRQQGNERNAYCWGRTSAGDPGNDTTTLLLRPTRVGAESDWVDLASNSSMTCGIRSEGGGTLWCFGQYILEAAVLDVPTQLVPESGWVKIEGAHSGLCALEDEGSLWCWGANIPLILGTGDPLPIIVDRLPVRLDGSEVWTDFAFNSGDDILCAVNTAGELNCRGGPVETSLGGGLLDGADETYGPVISDGP